MPRHAGHFPHLFQSWVGHRAPNPTHGSRHCRGCHRPPQRPEHKSPWEETDPCSSWEGGGMITAEGGPAGKGSGRAPGETKGAAGGPAWAGETGGNPVRGRPGEEQGGAEITALQTRSVVPSVPRGAAGRLSQPSGLHPPAPLRQPGPDSAAARGRPSPTSATAGPSAPRLPRPRLPPARPRARSPVHAAGHRPPPPGWGCTNEGRGRRRRSGGSAF